MKWVVFLNQGRGPFICFKCALVIRLYVLLTCRPGTGSNERQTRSREGDAL